MQLRDFKFNVDMIDKHRGKKLGLHGRLIATRFLFVVVLLTCLSLYSCKPDVKQLFSIAQQHFDRGEYKKAIDVYNQILERDSVNQLAFFERGQCNYYIGRHEEAIADYNKIISLQPPSDGQIELRWNRDSPFAPEEEKYKVYYEEALFERAVTEYQMDSARQAFKDFQVCLNAGYEKTLCKRYLGCLYIAYQKKVEGCRMLKEASFEGDTASYNLLQKFCY